MRTEMTPTVTPPYPPAGCCFEDWVGERRELKKAGGTDETQEEKDKLMQSKKASVDLSQSHMLEKENETSFTSAL